MEGIAPNRIKEMRLRRGMSLSELSELTGLTRSELHKLEKGVRRIRTDHLPPLSKSLKCAPEELLNPELAEQLIGDRMRYAGTVDATKGDGPTAVADLPVFGAMESDSRFIIDEAAPQAYVQRMPHLFNVKTAFAVYMPDTSMEPRVPTGSLVYINPILPARPGDLAVIRWNNGAAKIVMLTMDKKNGLVGIQENTDEEIILEQEQGVRIQRVIGISFM